MTKDKVDKAVDQILGEQGGAEQSYICLGEVYDYNSRFRVEGVTGNSPRDALKRAVAMSSGEDKAAEVDFRLIDKETSTGLVWLPEENFDYWLVVGRSADDIVAMW